MAGIIFLLLPVPIVLIASVDSGSTLSFPPRSVSMRWYANVFVEREWLTALINSVKFATVSAILAGILGAFGAYGTKHLTGRKKRLAIAAVIFPAVLPAVVIGVASLLFFSQIGLLNTDASIIISHTVLSLPVTFLVILSSASKYALDLEDVACAMGASRLYAISRVTVPALLPSIISATCLAFIISFDEAVVALFLTGRDTTTLPRKIFDGLRYDLDPTAAAVAGFLIVLWIILSLAAFFVWSKVRVNK